MRSLFHLKEPEAHPADLAVFDLGLGHKEKALAWLEKAHKYHDYDRLLSLKVIPFLTLCAQSQGSRIFCAA